MEWRAVIDLTFGVKFGRLVDCSVRGFVTVRFVNRFVSVCTQFRTAEIGGV